MSLKTAVAGYPILKSSRASAETIKTDWSQLHQSLDRHGRHTVSVVEPEDIGPFFEHHRDYGLSPHTIRRHNVILSFFN
ncbi:MAG: hypothetical protein PVH41_12740 [Anaerolineae bacterium]